VSAQRFEMLGHPEPVVSPGSVIRLQTKIFSPRADTIASAIRGTMSVAMTLV